MQLVTSAVAQELKELSRLGGDTGITLQPDENNIHVWKAYIKVCCFFYQELWYATELRICNTPCLTRPTAQPLCCLTVQKKKLHLRAGPSRHAVQGRHI